MLLHITRTSYQKYSFSYHLRKRMYSNSNLNFLPQQTDGGVNASMSIKAKVRKLQEVMKDNEEEEEEEEGNHKADNAPKNKWDQMWKDEITPWDLGRPTPLLATELIAHSHSRGEPAHFIPKNCKTVKVLVPGCGSGYDLNTIREYLESLPVLASEPCTEKTVVGLEISETSLNKAQQRICAILERSWSSSGKDNISSFTSKTIAVPDAIADCVDIQLKLGDFFEPCDKWSHHCSMNTRGGAVLPQPQAQLKEQNKLTLQTFDFIYDYTFFCALPPAARGRWGQRMSSLLKPKSGRLLTIMYPILNGLDCTGTGKALRGPPYPVTVDDYKRALEPHGFYITEGPYVHDDTVESREGQEYVCWWGLDDEKMRGPLFSFL